MRKFLYKRIIANFIILLLILSCAFSLMLKIDKQQFEEEASNDFKSLVMSTEPRDDYFQYGIELLFADLKSGLVDYVENRQNSLDYGVVLNADNIPKVTSKEAVMLYAIKNITEGGAYYWCDKEEFIEWLGEKEFENIIVRDAYLTSSGFFIPGEVEKTLLNTDNNFSYLLDRFEKYTHASETVKGIVNPDSYYFSLCSPIKGTPAQSEVFTKITERCEIIPHPKHIGDIECSFSAGTRYGAYQIKVFSGTNVIKNNLSRYILVLSLLGCFSVIIMAVGLLLSYNSKKNTLEKEEYRKNLMNNLAHDLKTPLTAMSGYAQNLLDNVNSEKKDHYATAIKENADYISEIIANVLTLSEYESGSRPLNTNDEDFVALTQKLWSKYKLMAAERGLAITFSGKFVRRVDASQINSALDNLLSNAIKHSKEGTKITVSGSTDCFFISNETAESLSINVDSLWTPFVKSDLSRSQRNGTGLGLSIVKTTLDTHGLKSQITCKENVFTVTIR